VLELTREQRDEMRHAGEAPVAWTDPETNTQYVVHKAELYDRMRKVYEEIDASLYEFDESS
jgi:hypothetical protein